MKYLTLDDFRKLEPGTVLMLGYSDTNTGQFVWIHHAVRGDRCEGRFAYCGDQLSKTGDYLYEFEGHVCRGSGAEPVFILPDLPEVEQEADYELR